MDDGSRNGITRPGQSAVAAEDKVTAGTDATAGPNTRWGHQRHGRTSPSCHQPIKSVVLPRLSPSRLHRHTVTVTPPPSHRRATQGGEDAGTPCCHQGGLFHDNQVGPLPPPPPNSSSFARAAGSAAALGRRPPPRHHHRRAHGGHHDGHRHGHRTHHGVARRHDGRRLWLCRRLLGRVGLLAQHIVFARRPGGWLALGRRWAGSTVYGDAHGRWAAATTRAATTHDDSGGWKSGGDVAGKREWGGGRDEQRMCGARRAEGLCEGASVCGAVDECIEGNTRLQRGSNAIDYPPRAHRARPAGVGWSAAACTRKRAGPEGNHPAGNRGGRGKGRRRCGACVLAGQCNCTGLALGRHTLVPGRRPQGLGSAWMAAAAAVGGAPGRPTPPLQCFPRMGRRPPAGGRGGPLTPPGGRVGDVAHPAYPAKVASRGGSPRPLQSTHSITCHTDRLQHLCHTDRLQHLSRHHQLPLHDAER